MVDHNSDNWDSDKTPILLHPARRAELLKRGQELFNDGAFFEAHEAWEELWLVEQGRDKTFVQGLILIAAHFVHLKKGNWSGATKVALNAYEKLRFPPAHRQYRELDIVPLTSALDYNLSLTEKSTPPPSPDAFIYPKLFEK